MLLIRGVLEQNVPLEMSTLKVYKGPHKDGTPAEHRHKHTHKYPQTEKAVKRLHTHFEPAQQAGVEKRSQPVCAGVCASLHSH